MCVCLCLCTYECVCVCVCVCVCARTQFWGNAAAVKPSLHHGPPGLGSSPLRWRGFGKVEAAVGLWL